MLTRIIILANTYAPRVTPHHLLPISQT